MNTKELIKVIKDFRKNKKGKCVSTTHTFTFEEFLFMFKDLQKTFKSFDVKVETDKVSVTIDMFRRRV